jgi:hypothetical protein
MGWEPNAVTSARRVSGDRKHGSRFFQIGREVNGATLAGCAPQRAQVPAQSRTLPQDAALLAEMLLIWNVPVAVFS